MCSLIKGKLFDRVPHRKTVSLSYVNNKKRKLYKPWWSEYLTELWNNVCVYEKYWLKASDRSSKMTLKSLYCSKRKLFDKEVQKSKRRYWYKLQCELLESVENDPNTFWKTIGKTGVASKKMHKIPMEFVNNDGSIEYDASRVLMIFY